MEKTIPIEIVLQDPNDPIVPPTPSDPTGGETGTTETSIAVPNTGDGIDTGAGNNMFTSSAATTATIASIVVLVLTIVAAIVLAVRRYRKRKTSESGITRQERRAIIVTSTVAVLALTVLLGQLLTTAVVQPNSTNAAAEDNSTSLTTPDKIQIVASRYDDVTIVASTKAISYASTTTSFGYKIFMSMAGDNANLYLDGDEASEYYFAPTTRAGLDNNSWGYNFDGEADYTAMPLASDPLMAQQSLEAVSDEEFTVYYTMKADKDMPFGVYSGEITYDIQGYSGFPTSLTTMQGMTPEICEATYTPNAFKADGVTIEDNVPTATLTDIRDNKTYTIAKLADGKCWMTQNLDLQKEDLISGVTLDNTNTDNPAAGFVLPDSQRSGDDSWIDTSDREVSVNTPHVYDLNDDGQEYYYCESATPWGTCESYSDEKIPAKDLGNYYNWYSATAGTGTYSLNRNEAATGSICPAGWRLPDGFDEERNPTDYSNLFYDYGIMDSPTSVGGGSGYSSKDVPKIFKPPFSYIRAGYYNENSGTEKVGITGMLWLSMSMHYTYADRFYFSYSSLQLGASGDSKEQGNSVRCVAR